MRGGTNMDGYDADLQMFVTDHPIDYTILAFLKWAFEHGAFDADHPYTYPDKE